MKDSKCTRCRNVGNHELHSLCSKCKRYIEVQYIMEIRARLTQAEMDAFDALLHTLVKRSEPQVIGVRATDGVEDIL